MAIEDKAIVGAVPQTGMNAAVGMFLVLLVVYSLLAADRYLLPVLATDVRSQFGFSLADTGLLTTIFTLGIAVGGLPTGYLLLRWSRKAVLVGGIAVASTGIGLAALASGFWSLLACLALTGIGMAMNATAMFSLATSHFVGNPGAAVGSVNFSYGLGGIYGPILATMMLERHDTWRAPMIAFGAAGFLGIVAILLTVKPWFSETRRAAESKSDDSGAQSLNNRNTILLTTLSVIHGLVLYGFLGMYPTYLREGLHYEAQTAGWVMSCFGLGAILSIMGGWLGDKFSPRLVLAIGFSLTTILGYLFFSGLQTVSANVVIAFAYGVVGSAILYVNLAATHVRAVRVSLAGRASGLFVTSLYASAPVAGYLIGWIANKGGWLLAGTLQMSLLASVGVVLALMLNPTELRGR